MSAVMQGSELDRNNTRDAAASLSYRLLLMQYGCAAVATIVAVCARFLLTPYIHEQFPYATVYFAVTLAAWYGGLGPALLAVLLGYLGIVYFVIPPTHSFLVHGLANWIGTLIFIFLGLFSAGLSGSMKRAQEKAEASAREARASAEALLTSEAQRRESEERLRMAADSARLGVWSYSEAEGCLTLSPFASQAMGLGNEARTLSKAGLRDTLYAADRLTVMRAIRNTLEKHAVFDTEYRVVWPDKSIHWLAARGEALPNAHTGQVLFSGVVQEITARKQSEQERETTLAEIEGLNRRLKVAMAETHHRVKNNLQVIAAMIDMQTMEETPSLPREEFLRLSRHVRTLASIHEILTREAKEYGDAQTLSARALLRQLLSTLQQAHMDHQLRQHIDEATLSTRQGTALALITNELVSNAIKHGQGVIEVRFTVQDNVACLETCDDGEGFPIGFDAQQAANTGLDLVQSLTQADLTGQISYANRPEGGARIRVTFAVSAA